MVLGMELEEAPLLEHRSWVLLPPRVCCRILPPRFCCHAQRQPGAPLKHNHTHSRVRAPLGRSLLTIGRCVVLNFHLAPAEEAVDVFLPPMPLAEGGRARRSLTFNGAPGGRGVLSDGAQGVDDGMSTPPGGGGGGQNWFDADYLLSSSPTSQSVYLDALDEFSSTPAHRSGGGDSGLPTAESGSLDDLSAHSFDLVIGGAGKIEVATAAAAAVPLSRRRSLDTMAGTGPTLLPHTRLKRALSAESMDSMPEHLADGTPLTFGYQGREEGAAGKPFRCELSTTHRCHRCHTTIAITTTFATAHDP